LIPEKLKNLLRGSRAPAPPPAPPAGGGRALFVSRALEAHDAVISRHSRGLEQFFDCIRGQSGLTILDLGGAIQQNVHFITNLGHRLYSEDFLRILEETFGADEDTGQSNPGRIEYFLRNALDYPECHFDGVLLWDVLEYVEPPLLAAVIERLRQIVRPNSHLLAFFHSDDKLESVPYYSFRILDVKTLQVAQSGTRRPARLFNNRGLEKLFQPFGPVKFFLTRDRLREVIVRS
jgi:2-polyprenyl-3-methyl-5-hydroxy-6-metoxy-1,4-benzoquinol methylase